MEMFNLKEEPSFLSSDYCTECGGVGFVSHKTQLFDDVEIEKEQCSSCEQLRKSELKADRLEDEAKGN